MTDCGYVTRVRPHRVGRRTWPRWICAAVLPQLPDWFATRDVTDLAWRLTGTALACYGQALLTNLLAFDLIHVTADFGPRMRPRYVYRKGPAPPVWTEDDVMAARRLMGLDR